MKRPYDEPPLLSRLAIVAAVLLMATLLIYIGIWYAAISLGLPTGHAYISALIVTIVILYGPSIVRNWTGKDNGIC